MKTIFIHPHPGFGDQIICNGLVRELTETENADITYLLVHPNTKESTVAMYSDDSRIVCIIENEAYACIQQYSTPRIEELLPKFKDSKTFIIGFDNLKKNYDVSFYDSVGVSFEKRWSSFKCNRNKEKEKELELLINPSNEEFNLVQYQASIGIYKYEIPKNIKTIYFEPISSPNGYIFNMVDWYGLIEKAKEIHGVSSLVHFGASIRETGFYHDFGRDSGWGGYITLPENWITVDERKGRTFRWGMM